MADKPKVITGMSPEIMMVMKAFNLPEHVCEFTIRCKANDMLTIDCEYLLYEDQLKLDEMKVVTEQFVLVPRAAFMEDEDGDIPA